MPLYQTYALITVPRCCRRNFDNRERFESSLEDYHLTLIIPRIEMYSINGYKFPRSISRSASRASRRDSTGACKKYRRGNASHGVASRSSFPSDGNVGNAVCDSRRSHRFFSLPERILPPSALSFPLFRSLSDERRFSDLISLVVPSCDDKRFRRQRQTEREGRIGSRRSRDRFHFADFALLLSALTFHDDVSWRHLAVSCRFASSTSLIEQATTRFATPYDSIPIASTSMTQF